MNRMEWREKKKTNAKKELLEWGKVIVISVIAALIITTFVKPTLVEGESMYPTIGEHDYLIVNCLSYLGESPQYGDIIVFETQMKTDEGKDKNLIKRVIGLPGDVISVREGKVIRNGQVLEEPYINGDYTPGDVEEITVSEHHVFVLGDNRPNSLDSRSEQVGLVDYEDIVGNVLVRLFPLDRIGGVK